MNFTINDPMSAPSRGLIRFSLFGRFVFGPVMAFDDCVNRRGRHPELPADRRQTHRRRQPADFTSGLVRQLGRPLEARIVASRQQSQVIRIDTGWICAVWANVIDNHPIGYRAESRFVIERVPAPSSSIPLQTGISSLETELPNPAAGLGIDSVGRSGIRRGARIVTANVFHGLATNPSPRLIGDRGEIRRPTTSAGTQEFGVGVTPTCFDFSVEHGTAITAERVRTRVWTIGARPERECVPVQDSTASFTRQGDTLCGHWSGPITSLLSRRRVRADGGFSLTPLYQNGRGIAA